MKLKMNFRRRLIISHILPVLLMVPLVGFALIYLMETRVFLPAMANEMINQGMLVQRLTQDQPEIWTSPAAAQSLLNSINSQQPSSINLLTPDHRLLATTLPDDANLVGKIITNLPDTTSLQNPWWSITSGDISGERILDVVIPVHQTSSQTIGVIRIYRHVADLGQGLSSMKLLILIGLFVGLFFAGIVAFFFSKSVSLQLKNLTRSIADAPLEGPYQNLSETGDQELAELSQAYNRLQSRRRELEETRQQMLANVIHEIGRPLGSLRTALHALKAGAMDDPALRLELMNGMTERVDRMGRLLEDLALTYRSLEPQEIHKKDVPVKEWFNSLTPLWAESARQKQLFWEALIPDNLPVIQTDPDRLAQVLSNLVNNAIKFTPTQGKVTLSILLEKKSIQFLISDTGIGIPAEDQPHLFIPFYRSIQPPWKAPGLGLGLSIAKTITESLGGQIILRSAPNQGSTFIISLPIN